MCQLHLGAAIASEFTLEPVSQASTARTRATIPQLHLASRSLPRVEIYGQSSHLANRDTLGDMGTVERNWRTTLPEPATVSLRDASHRAAVSPSASWGHGAGRSAVEDEEKMVSSHPADWSSMILDSSDSERG